MSSKRIYTLAETSDKATGHVMIDDATFPEGKKIALNFVGLTGVETVNGNKTFSGDITMSNALTVTGVATLGQASAVIGPIYDTTFAVEFAVGNKAASAKSEANIQLIGYEDSVSSGVHIISFHQVLGSADTYDRIAFIEVRTDTNTGYGRYRISTRGAGGNSNFIMDKDGNIGIGHGEADTIPFKLEVLGVLSVITSTSTQYAARFWNTGGEDYWGLRVAVGDDDQSTGTYFYFRAQAGLAGAEEGGLANVNGTFDLYSNSDERFKIDIADATLNATTLLTNMPVRKFKRQELSNISPEQLGWIAQEVAAWYPQMYMYIADSDRHAIRPAALIPVLHKALIEVFFRLDALEV